MLLTFKVFGKLVQLNMHRNDQIVSPDFEEWKNKTKGVTEKMSELETSNSCFHIYEDDYFRSAAFNICQEHGLVSNIVKINFYNVTFNLYFSLFNI